METLKDITMQIFKGKFIAFFSLYLTTLAFAFLYKIATTPTTELNEHAGVIVGFLTATVIGSLVSFWYGAANAQNSDKNENPPSSPPAG